MRTANTIQKASEFCRTIRTMLIWMRLCASFCNTRVAVVHSVQHNPTCDTLGGRGPSRSNERERAHRAVPLAAQREAAVAELTEHDARSGA